MKLPIRSLATFAVLAVSASSASALALLPFTEDFLTTANWRQNTSTADVLLVNSGGPNGAGDSYVSYDRNLGTSLMAGTTFRAQDAFNSSNDAFVGDWVAGGVMQFSFFIRHNAPAPLAFGTRFATPENSPAFSILTAPASVAPGVWTKITFDIYDGNPALLPEGMNLTFNSVFSQIGNVQILAQRDASIPTNTIATIDLDKVTMSNVPEPTTALLLGAATLPLLARRRNVLTAK